MDGRVPVTSLSVPTTSANISCIQQRRNLALRRVSKTLSVKMLSNKGSEMQVRSCRIIRVGVLLVMELVGAESETQRFMPFLHLPSVF